MLSDSDSNGHIANSAAEANGNELFAKVLIVGGGPVGCLTALKLGKAGIKVDIIERLPSTSNAPRAVGYFGAVHFVFEELGLYSKIRKAGFVTPGLCWFKKPRDNGQGGKAFGEMLAAQPLAEPGDVEFKVGAGLLNLTQAKLNALLLEEALATGHVKIHFNTEFESILENSQNGVVARARNLETGEEIVFRSQYLVGTDGARSGTRKALQLPFAGHTWPERLIATDVVMMNEELLSYPTYFVLDRVHYSVSTPLEKPIKGEKSLWRFTFGSDPNDTRPDEELMSDDNIMSLYERNMAGQRPLDVKITNRAVYKIHQRLAPTLRKGNCLLAGDAAHANNPFGALGLNTGILDADAAGEALIMVVNEGKSDALFNVYSDERRKVFQFFVDPTSTQNKLRVHNNPDDTAVQDDWYFRMMARGPTQEEVLELMKPYFETWRTDMRKLATRGT